VCFVTSILSGRGTNTYNIPTRNFFAVSRSKSHDSYQGSCESLDKRLDLLGRFLNSQSNQAEQTQGSGETLRQVQREIQTWIAKDPEIVSQAELNKYRKNVAGLTSSVFPPFTASKYGGFHPATCSDPIRNLQR